MYATVKKYWFWLLVALVVPAGVALATPSSVDRITDHIQPLIVGDYIKGQYFIATSTSVASTLPYASTTALSVSQLTSGRCVQTGTGGILTVTGSACGVGAGTVTQINTTFPVLGGPITTSGTITFGGLSTSTAAVIGNIPYYSGVNTFANVATTTASCSGGTSCTAFTIIGSSPVTITGTSGTVTAVTGSFPIASSGGATPNITWLGLGTSTPFAANQFVYTNNGSNLVTVASSSLNLPNSALTNSSITINTISSLLSGGGAVSLGGTLNINASTSPTVGYITATSSTPSQLPYASTTMISATTASTTNLIVSGVRSALHLADANGIVSAYAGSSNPCTNQLPTTISAVGALGGCTSVTNAMLSNSSVTINTISMLLSGGGSVALGATLNINASTSPTVGYITATSSTPSQIPYASSTAVSVSNLTSGNCVQASTGGLLTTISGACGSSSGTVTSIVAGTGLTGGTITNAGTIALSSYLATSSAETQGQIPYYTSTNGTPATLGGVATGTISNGSGIAVTAGRAAIGGSLTITNTGVTSISGTANQISASASTGAVVLSFPSLIINPNASTTQFSNLTRAYFGATATTTIDSTGNIVIPSGSSLTNTGRSDGCATWSSAVLTSTGVACGSGSGSSFPFTPTTNFGINTNATSTRLSLLGGLYASSTASAPNIMDNLSVGGAGLLQYGSPFEIASSSSSTVQAIIRNNQSNTAGTSSSDLIFENASSTNTTYYGDLGLNSPANIDLNYTAFGAQDLYLYNTDANLDLATASSTTGAIQFFTGGTSLSNLRVLIDKSGNFGVGTTSPGTLLAVNGGATIGGKITAQFFSATSTTNASTFPYASTTMISATTASTTNLIVSGVRSALHLADANGIVSAYGGAGACGSNNFITTISAVGGTTCGTASISGVNLGSNLNSATFNNSGTGGASASTYNGSAALTVSYNTIGALSTTSTWTVGNLAYVNSNSLLTSVATSSASCSGNITCSAFTVVGSVSPSIQFTGTLPVANGGTNASTFTAGSVVFAGASGTYTQNNSNFFWDNTLVGLGLGTTTPRWLLNLATSTAPQLTLSDTSATANPWSLRSISGNFYLGTSSPSTFATSTNPFLSVVTAAGFSTTTFSFTDFVIKNTSAAMFSLLDGFGTQILNVNSASTTGSIFTVAATTSPNLAGGAIKLFDVDQYGHLTASSTRATPTVSCTPSGGTIAANSNDVTGDITTGTASTACTVTFASAYATTPEVLVTANGSVSFIAVSARSTTAFTITPAAAVTTDNISYFVIQP